MKRMRLNLIFVLLCMALCMVPCMAQAEETSDTGEEAEVSIALNSTNFPDSNFLSYVKTNFDSDSSKSLSASEIASATSINCCKDSIKSLVGIEYFTELQELNCAQNSLTELDLSHNTKLKKLYCYSNKLKKLDLSKNTALTYLSCFKNSLTELDLTNNTSLVDLSCQYNALTVLDLTNNKALKEISYGNNQVTSLDLNNVTYSLITDHLSGGSNTYMVKGTSDRTFDLSTLPGKFDVSRIKTGSGGTVSGTILTFNENSDTYQYYYIVRYNNSWTNQFTISLHTHTNFGSWVSNGDGTHTKTCKTSGCGFTETESCTGGTATCTKKRVCTTCKGEYGQLNTSNHTGENSWTQTATTHMKQWTCCEKVTVAETKHTWRDGVCSVCSYVCEHTGGTATCMSKAVCEICGQPYGELAPDNHTKEIAWVQTANTHAKGYNCCGVLTSEAADHKWDAGVCTECGYVCKHSGGVTTCIELATCEICGQKYGELDANNHVGDKEIKDAVAATCTEAGYTGDVYCKSCSRKIETGSTIDALGHEASETYTYDKTSHWKTCTRDGCSVVLEQENHTGGIATVDKPATCEVCGQAYGKCLPGYATISGTSVTSKAGKQITVDIKLVENTGLASMLIELDYNSDVLEYVSATNGEVFSDGSFNAPNASNSSKVLLWQNGDLTKNIKKTGKLATLTFNIKEGANPSDYEIAFKCDGEKYEAIDAEMNALNVATNSAKVKVVEFIYGDVDDDGRVDATTDVLQLKRYIARWDGYTVNERNSNLDGDTTEDGKPLITLRDLTILQRHVAGWKQYQTLPMMDETLPL